MGTSNADGTTPLPVYVDSATNRMLVSATFTGTTVSEYAEDAPHTSGDLGVMALAVRQDTQADFAADGDYVPLSIDADGALRVNISSLSGTTVSEYAEDAPHTSGDKGVMALAVRQDTQVDFAADGDYVPLSIDADGALRVSGGGGGTQYTDQASQSAPVGTVALGHDGASVQALTIDTDGNLQIDVLTIAAGDNNIGNVDVLSISAGDNNIGNVDIVTLPALVTGSAEIGSVISNLGATDTANLALTQLSTTASAASLASCEG